MTDLNNIKPLPAAAITMGAPVDAMGERYRVIAEFDLSSEESYDAFLVEYPNAWEAYYEEDTAPSYTPENALKLQEAVKFYLYMNEDEFINVEPHDLGLDGYDGGIIDDPEAVRVESPNVPRWEGPYEHPNAFYDGDVYKLVSVEDSVPLPYLEVDGDKDIADRLVERPYLADVYSAEQLAMNEYQTTHSLPKSPWDWGGSYAGTGKTY